MNLSNFTHGRDNNFNLIRIIAAFAVLITHSFALAIGTGDAEPFRKSLGMTMGMIAVDVFFITSGFLVTASLLSRQSAIDFIWARVLRILPALLIMLLITVSVIGVFFTSLPLRAYLANPGVYIYLLKGSTLIGGVAYDLPGAFADNPYRGSVNGSLWTLPYEVRMYAILVTVWVALRMARSIRLKAFQLAIISGAVAGGICLAFTTFVKLDLDQQFMRLFYMFFSGAAFYVLKEHITLSRAPLWFFVILLLSSVMANSLRVFFVVYVLTIPYILFYIAYVPAGRIRKYNRLGDYSYGVYIYAFPVQQSVAALIPGVSVSSMLFISASFTLLLAVLSWHFLERHALGLKGFYVGHTRRILAYGQTGSTGRTR